MIETEKRRWKSISLLLEENSFFTWLRRLIWIQFEGNFQRERRRRIRRKGKRERERLTREREREREESLFPSCFESFLRLTLFISPSSSTTLSLSISLSHPIPVSPCLPLLLNFLLFYCLCLLSFSPSSILFILCWNWVSFCLYL